MANNEEFTKNDNWKTPSFEEVLCESNSVKIKEEHQQNDENIIIPEIPPQNIIYVKEEQQLSENIEIVNNMGLTESIYVINIIANDILSNTQYLDCSKCGEKYELFCIKCRMLVHILDKNLAPNDLDIPLKTIPENILEVRGCYDGFGVFAKRTIPKNVKFGPFIGLDNLQCTTGSAWKLRHGELVRVENGKFSNWMQYIRHADKIENQNLNVFQFENQLYYRTNRIVNAGEQLLVYYGVENANNSNNNNDEKTFFFPKIESNLQIVYACTFCCIGFSMLGYLRTHKTTCSYLMNIQMDTGSVNQCLLCKYCKIYMDMNEYRYYHLNNCHYKYTGSLQMVDYEELDGNVNVNNNEYMQNDNRESTSCNSNAQPNKIIISIPAELAPDDKLAKETSAVKNPEITNDKKFKCLKCSYSTNYSQSLKRHMCNIHDEKKPYQCPICNRQFTQKGSLTLHIANKHTDEKKEYKCTNCSFSTTRKNDFKKHGNCHLRAENVSSNVNVENFDSNADSLIIESEETTPSTFQGHIETHNDNFF